MIIRKTAIGDLDAVCEIYADAREFMRQNGNPNQWKNAHPARDVIVSDMGMLNKLFSRFALI